jgi:hypothetical protein
MGDSPFLGNAVEVDITPPVGTALDGYFARPGVSRGIHDPLKAQVLLLRSGAQQIALICLDLLGVNLEFSQRVREGVETAIGVPGDCIMLACSHTHSGPAGFLPPNLGLPITPDLELQQEVARKVIGAATWAQERLRPARLGVGRGNVDGIGRNRNDPEAGPSDQEVIVLRVDDEAGEPLAVLMNYGCHPTVLGAENLQISADYPGAARGALRSLYPNTTFLYTNGASGDVSTRFMRREQTFAEVRRMGHILAGEVLKVMETVITGGEAELRGRLEAVELVFRPYPAPEEAQRELERLQAQLEAVKASGASHGEIRVATTRVEGATAQQILAEGLAGRTHNLSQVQVLRIGDLCLVGIPGEPFTRTVQEIKAKSKAPVTAVVSYANDEEAYFPDALSVAEGTYEALVSPFGPEVAERLREVALRLGV